MSVVLESAVIEIEAMRLLYQPVTHRLVGFCGSTTSDHRKHPGVSWQLRLRDDELFLPSRLGVAAPALQCFAAEFHAVVAQRDPETTEAN